MALVASVVKARKPRSDAKIYQLPRAVLDGVNERLVNYNMSYADIVAWLAEQGYKVSQSSLSPLPAYGGYTPGRRHYVRRFSQNP